MIKRQIFQPHFDRVKLLFDSCCHHFDRVDLPARAFAFAVPLPRLDARRMIVEDVKEPVPSSSQANAGVIPAPGLTNSPILSAESQEDQSLEGVVPPPPYQVNDFGAPIKSLSNSPTLSALN